MNNFDIQIGQVSNLCHKHNIVKLYLFGSFAKEKATENSDIDFLVTFGNVELYNYFDNYLNFKEALEKLYRRKVDLVEEQTVKNPFLLQSINEIKILIYG